ncbi:hypothetical protein FDECE_3879 [Fusarium decemcellulare]|nr:hypothetical protein FDECE_3879 [Fusarium decemcellulare]
MEHRPTSDNESIQRVATGRNWLDSALLQLQYGPWSYTIWKICTSWDIVAAVGFNCCAFGFSWPSLIIPAMSWVVTRSLYLIERKMLGKSCLMVYLDNVRLPAALFTSSIHHLGVSLTLTTTVHVSAIPFTIVAAAFSFLYLQVEQLPQDKFVYQDRLSSLRHGSGIHITPASPDYVNIRLLRLHPKLPFRAVKGSLRKTGLTRGERPGYEAISYTWGKSPVKDKTLVVDGRALACTSATYNALQNSTSWWHSRYVWIDAVCINQEDQVEKAEQVACMRYIYSRATVVRVQIDPCMGEDTCGAASLIRKIAWFIYDFNPLSSELGSFFQWEKDSWNRRGALVDFFANPWFSRVWIIQEVVCGSPVRVTYGTEFINWYSMETAADALLQPACKDLLLHHARGAEAKKHATALQKIAHTKQLHHENFAYAAYMHTDPDLRALFSVSLPSRVLPLSTLLSTYCRSRATDSRDKIYALLGLVIDSAISYPSIWPDYGQSLDKLMNLTTHHIISARSYMDIISFVGNGNATAHGEEHQLKSIQSWVANWAYPPLGMPLNDHLSSQSGRTFYKAATHFSHELKIEEDDKLSIRGKLVDYITEVGPGDSADCADIWSLDRLIKKNPDGTVVLIANRINKLIDHHDKSLKLVSRLEKANPRLQGDSDHVRECFWRTLVGDRSHSQRPAISEVGIMYDAWLAELHILATSPSPQITGHVLRLFATWFEQLEYCALGRKICITNKGFMGMVPMGARAGDLVALFHGAAVPFVIRQAFAADSEGRQHAVKSKGNTDVYEMVGECYMHGLMDGEGIGRPQTSDLLCFQ